MTEISFFHEEIYQPFYWHGGRQAALLVHGFPGTPAEVRPLAEALFAQGWTVQAPLLPGFGTQIDKLFDQTRENWVTAVAEAHAALRANHDAVLLVGYSMGGAIALNVAAQVPPDRLALLAPFWRIGTEVHQAIWQGVKRFIPEFQLFKRVDFTDPRMQKAFGAVFPNIDLEDSEIQTFLQEMRVPARLVDEVLALGLAAKEAAGQIHASTLVIQGSIDQTISPKATHLLLRELAGQARYVEVAAGHALTDVETAVWPQIKRALLDFAKPLQSDPAA